MVAIPWQLATRRQEGRDFNVRSETAVTISLAIHELCTNAFKYGALSSDHGTVQISWSLTADTPPKFAFEWLEAPAQRLGSSLGGTVDLLYEPEGLRMRFTSALPAVSNVS